jgi:hypothetical protein
VKIAIFICRWIEWECDSLIENYTGIEEFRLAGYQPIFTDHFEIRGQVRQCGNFSFSRLYQAGHVGMVNFPCSNYSCSDRLEKVPSYQTELSYKLFMLILFNRDMATGTPL